MRTLNRSKRAFTTALVAVAAALSILQAAQAGAPSPTVPDRIAVEDGNKVFLVGHAVGVQIYACNGTAWGLVAPRANLYDDSGKPLATHYAGPTWEARDGSKVVGSVVDRVTVDADAIPWLLLKATPVTGRDVGRLGATTFIQRIATTGGLAPSAAECNAATAGAQREIPYTADYYFWKKTGS
jgi:hypothetical protein